MKLSEVLEKYYVMALNFSEIVGFVIPDPPDEAIEIKWVDSENLDVHEQYFNDQEIQLLDHPRGGFFVDSADGESCGFIALDGVDLKIQRMFVGEEHPRFIEWRDECAAGNTLFGLADWLEHTPIEGDD